MTTVGIIGLGEMGLAIANRLISQGFMTVGYDPATERYSPAEAAGVRIRSSPAAVADECDGPLLLNVGTDAHVGSAWREPGGALSSMKARTLVVMSTLSPGSVQALSDEAQAVGGFVVDAPHTGSSPAALSGNLIIWLSGDTKAIEGVRPVLDKLASATHVIGPRPGMAQAVKLINAMGLAINLMAVAEMLSVAQQHGIDGEILMRVIEGGSGSSWVTSAMPGVASFLTEHHISNLHKDLRAVMLDATRGGYPMPVTSAAMHSLRYTWPREPW
jgi:3-hydroxyisobutyrate dehydrogenase-like beta-hydroxyacid dehydrogenase